MFQICVIRAEGVADSPEYLFYLENKPLQESFQSSEPTYLISGQGNLQVIVRDKAKKKSMLSVGFSTSLLPREGFQWVPLFQNTQNLLKEFPDEVQSPRLLIMISSDLFAPIDEISEIDCEMCESLKADKFHLQQEVAQLSKESKIALDNFTAENEKNKMMMKKFQSLHLECKKELENVKTKYEEERRKNLEMSEKIKTLTAQFEENIQKGKMREAFLEGLINDREKEYKGMGMEKIVLTKVQNSEIKAISPSASALPQLNLLQTSQHNENSLSNTANSIKSLGQKEPASATSLQTRRKVLTEINSPQTTTTDTSTALRDFLKRTNRLGLFTKDSGNMYKFGKKKVFITVKHGNLLCRVGGGFENIEDFICKNSENKAAASPSASKLHRRHKTVDEVQKPDDEFMLENSAYCRSSPEIESLIRMRLRTTSNCTSE
jgi:hypothetical protein